MRRHAARAAWGLRVAALLLTSGGALAALTGLALFNPPTLQGQITLAAEAAQQEEAPNQILDGSAPPAEPGAALPGTEGTGAEEADPAEAGKAELAGAVEAEPGELFLNANAAYEAGRYGAAIELYRQLIELGVEDGRLHYNLGNAYLRNGDLGRSIASYREAQQLRPRDEDLRANLSFARQSTEDAIAAPEPSALLETLFFWHYGLSPREVATAALVLNILFWGVWLVRLFRRDSETLRWLFILLLVLLVATAGSLLFHRLWPRPVAVIVPPEVEAHTAPDAESVVRFKLHAGTELAVKDQREDWLRVALPDGQQGWVRREWAAVVGD